jgi:hypothetical protein
MSACHKCKRDINNGTEGQKAVTVFKLPDGELTYRVPSEGTTPLPGGKLFAVYHYKCYKVAQKVERRTADPGSLIGKEGMPSGYEVSNMVMNRDEARERGLSIEEAMAMTTSAMSDRAQATLHQSIRKGKDLQDRKDAEAEEAAVQVQREDDPDYDPDKERPGSWPAGGQRDMEI